MTSERELFDAYRRGEHWAAPCECGLEIRSKTATPQDVEDAVAVHQHSTVHRRWRSWQKELERTPPVRYGP